MSFHVKDDFTPGTPIAAVGAGWFNTVAGFINGLIGGLGIKVVKPRHPGSSAPVQIDIDPGAVEQAILKNQMVFKEFETPTATKSTGNTAPTGHAGNSGRALLTADTWTRGDTDTNGNLKGMKVYLPTDCWDNKYENCLAWRLCEFDGAGRLQSVGAQIKPTFAASAEWVANIENQL